MQSDVLDYFEIVYGPVTFRHGTKQWENRSPHSSSINTNTSETQTNYSYDHNKLTIFHLMIIVH